jgi:hypothetical protein
MDARIMAFLARQVRETVPFADTLALIGELYDYTPAAFTNGQGADMLESPAGSNEGSCKVFAFARMNGLDAGQTLACFGEHFQAVLADPQGSSHPNIRLFMRYGPEGVRFQDSPLTPRA